MIKSTDLIAIDRKGEECSYFLIGEGEWSRIIGVIVNLHKRTIDVCCDGWDTVYDHFSDINQFMDFHAFLKKNVWNEIIYYVDLNGHIDWRESAEA